MSYAVSLDNLFQSTNDAHVYITNYICTLIFFTHMCVFTIYVDRKKNYVIIDKILRILWQLFRLQEISRMIA